MISNHIILFRASKGQEDPYDLVLQQAGFTPHFLKVLHFEYAHEQEVRSALLGSSYSGLIFTSQTAVESSICALSEYSAKTGHPWEEIVRECWKDLPVFVVGKATSQAVGRLGLRSHGSFSGNAEVLSQVIIDYFSGKNMSHPLLFLCGNLRRDTLSTALEGAALGLHSIVCYNTVAHPSITSELQSLDERKELSDPIYAVFFSPSGVEFALDKLLSMCRDTTTVLLAAIGPTTAEALTSAGYPPQVISSKPTPDCLVKALTELHCDRKKDS